ncbi:MAG: glycosyltransferase family 4 protein [Chloroflexi bacterium]|nr:glycosyltransferase family 4 protein [Chloroflexota bacterium]
MRIAIASPLFESIPPQRYGGTERVVSSLTEELVRRGHEVSLFASGDSRTGARLVAITREALWPRHEELDHWPFHLLELGSLFERAHDFDLVHTHLEYFPLPFIRLARTPCVLTMHGRLDLLEYQRLFAAYPDANLVSISNNQRRPLPYSNWVATVYNGIELEDFTFRSDPADYLAFLGRMWPEKGVEDAIEIARQAGMPLRIAARINHHEQEYFRQRIQPRLDPPAVEYVGELDQRQKNVFLGHAYALLFPIRWPEPFGLVMVEAMACGTPVIARRAGAAPEVIVDGATGLLCDSVEEMALACGRIQELDRAACRRRVAERFSVQTMVDGYERVYRSLAGQERARRAG